MFSGPYYLPKSYHPYGSHTYGEIGGPDGYLARIFHGPLRWSPC
jgi:hypothetical protein